MNLVDLIRILVVIVAVVVVLDVVLMLCKSRMIVVQEMPTFRPVN